MDSTKAKKVLFRKRRLTGGSGGGGGSKNVTLAELTVKKLKVGENAVKQRTSEGKASDARFEGENRSPTLFKKQK